MREFNTDWTLAEQVLASGAPQQVGSLRLYFAGQRWEWSDEVARMHGYKPGTVVPTTELLLKHKHPEDRARVATSLTELLEHGTPFSSQHRIVDTNGRSRHVLVVGDRMLDDDGTAIGTIGFYVDLTESRRREMDSVVADLAESRAVIEQAKGMVMLVYGIDAQHAFDVLQWRSQTTNTKLRALAKQLVFDITTSLEFGGLFRQTFDHLLLTTHQRIVAREVVET
jgi:PAS domain S-box-containing protein